MVIYAIVCNVSLKLYVGQHKDDHDLNRYFARKWHDAHRHSGKRSHLYAALRKYPRDSWSIHPLVAEIESKAELDETERLLIYALKTQHPDVGYNICDGGEGFTGKHTPEWVEMMRQVNLGNTYCLGIKQSPASIAKRVAANTGKTRTPEQCQRLASARKGKGLGQRNAAGKRTGQALLNLQEMNVRRWTPQRRAEQAERIRKASLGRVPWNKKFVEVQF